MDAQRALLNKYFPSGKLDNLEALTGITISFGEQPPNCNVTEQQSPFANLPSDIQTGDRPQLHPIVESLNDIGISAVWLGVKSSCSYERHLIKPSPGVKVSSILNSTKDIQMALGLNSPPVVQVRNGAIAIDLPRHDRQTANFSDYWQPSQKLEAALGVNIDNQLVTVDLRNPDTCHFLVGGTTGSGKSVWLQSFYLSLALAHPPEVFQAIICDPKRVSFSSMRESANLREPIIYDAEKAEPVLDRLIDLMEDRYKLLEKTNTQDIEEYCQKTGRSEARILFICDEIGDLLDASRDRKGCENKLVRLAQKARAAGINICLATQRPDKDTVTPRLRSNLVVRIALRVKSVQDSAIILGGGDTSINATSLFGKGDLFFEGERFQALLPCKSDFERLQKKTERSLAIDINSEIKQEYIDALTDISNRKGWLTAAIAQQSSRKFKTVDANQIRELFVNIAKMEIGEIRGQGTSLEWKI